MPTGRLNPFNKLDFYKIIMGLRIVLIEPFQGLYKRNE